MHPLVDLLERGARRVGARGLVDDAVQALGDRRQHLGRLSHLARAGGGLAGDIGDLAHRLDHLLAGALLLSGRQADLGAALGGALGHHHDRVHHLAGAMGQLHAALDFLAALLGRQHGWYRVGPLARLNTCDFIPTPLAQRELEIYRAYTGGRPNGMSMHMHWARLVEALHAAEVIRALIRDPDLLAGELIVMNSRRREYVNEGLPYQFVTSQAQLSARYSLN